jgi:REP element-mobilizing transposase RayT
MSRSRYRFNDEAVPHFVTCSVVEWLPLFSRPDVVGIVLDSWRFLQQHRRITLFGYVIMENHLHAIAGSSNLSKELGDFKSFTARRIIDLLRERHDPVLELLEWFKARHKTGQQFQLWQEGSHPQQVLNEEMMIQKLEYIHYNPVKRGYVDEPTDWRYSSARNYAGRGGLIEVCTDWR